MACSVVWALVLCKLCDFDIHVCVMVFYLLNVVALFLGGVHYGCVMMYLLPNV